MILRVVVSLVNISILKKLVLLVTTLILVVMNSYLLSVLRKCVRSCRNGLLIISSLTICTFILLSFRISLKNMNLLHVVTQHILKGYVKVIILLTLNRSRRIIKCVVIGVLFTCALFGLSSAPIFAASEDSLSSEVFPVGFYEDPVYDKLASDTRATEYTTTDIYNLLYSAMRTENYNSIYSLPKIASYTNRIAQTLYGSGQSVPSQSLYANLREIHEILNGLSSGVYVRPDIQSTLFRTDPDTLDFITVSQDLGSLLDQANNIAGYTAQIHGDGQNNSYYLSNLDSKAAILNSSWTAFNVTYNGWSSSLNGTYSSDSNPANATNVTYYFKFTNASGANTYRFARLFMQMFNTGIVDAARVNVYAAVGNQYVKLDTEAYVMGRYVYLTDLPNNFASSQPFVLEITFDNVTFTSTKTITAEYLPDSIYSLLSNAELDLRLINRHFDSIGSDVSTLAKYLADPDKVAAEEASQQVIDDTLDGFTGNGSAAAKTSDTGSMKNMSGSIQSGLSTGASAGNAASVFSNQTFWSWFTQATSNGINNPYPAPVVQNTRGSGDDVPDFLSGNQAELNDLLNQRNSW